MRFFACVLVFVFLCVPVRATERANVFAPDQVEARAVILIERKSGRVLYEMNADQMMPIASITKVMTALIAIEHADPDEVVTVSKDASGVSGTSLYLGEGEQLTVEELLLGLMLRSGNDAAVALAQHVAGDVDSFVKLMNDRAALLGADAYFTNPHGLDEREHSASARGMALIANEAMDYPAFRSLVTTKSAIIPWPGNPYERVLTNKNKLLTTYDGTTGVKTGFTDRAGRCLIFSAERDGMELLGVVLNCGQWFDAGAKLLNWGFEHYRLKTFLKTNQEIARIPVEGGMAGEVAIVVPMALIAPSTDGEAAELVIDYEKMLIAPVEEGLVIGRADVVVDGEVIASRALLAANSVDKRTYPAALLRAARHFNPVR